MKAPTRRVNVTTWQPAGRIQRTLQQHRLSFNGDVDDLIRRAAQLVPQWRAQKATLYLGNSCGEPWFPQIRLLFGARDGVEISVEIRLQEEDQLLAFRYHLVRVVDGPTLRRPIEGARLRLTDRRSLATLGR